MTKTQEMNKLEARYNKHTKHMRYVNIFLMVIFGLNIPYMWLNYLDGKSMIFQAITFNIFIIINLIFENSTRKIEQKIRTVNREIGILEGINYEKNRVKKNDK